MRLFSYTFGNEYILLAMDYASKWVEVFLYRTSDAKLVVKFLRGNIFARFGIPYAIISD